MTSFSELVSLVTGYGDATDGERLPAADFIVGDEDLPDCTHSEGDLLGPMPLQGEGGMFMSGGAGEAPASPSFRKPASAHPPTHSTLSALAPPGGGTTAKRLLSNFGWVQEAEEAALEARPRAASAQASGAGVATAALLEPLQALWNDFTGDFDLEYLVYKGEHGVASSLAPPRPGTFAHMALDKSCYSAVARMKAIGLMQAGAPPDHDTGYRPVRQSLRNGGGPHLTHGESATESMVSGAPSSVGSSEESEGDDDDDDGDDDEEEEDEPMMATPPDEPASPSHVLDRPSAPAHAPSLPMPSPLPPRRGPTEATTEAPLPRADAEGEALFGVGDGRAPNDQSVGYII